MTTRVGATSLGASTASRSPLLHTFLHRRGVTLGDLQAPFPRWATSRRLVKQLAATLAVTVPEPNPGFESWALPRIAKSLEMLQRWLSEGMVVMDLASSAHFSLLAMSLLPGVRWIPTEFEGSAVDFHSAVDGSLVYGYRPRSLFLSAGPLKLPHPSALDAVTLFEVVEHLPSNPASLFGSIGDSLKDGGLLVLSTPNICSRTAMLRQMRGGSPYQFTVIGDDLSYHKREYSSWELRRLLTWAGFAPVEVRTYNVYTNDPRGAGALIHHLAWIAGAALNASPVEIRNLVWHYGSTTFVVARKVSACDWSKPMPLV